MDDATSRRRLLATLAVGLLLATSGCLTVGSTVEADTARSDVFESFSSTEPWSSGHVRTKVSLAANATTDGNVTRLVVVAEDGTRFYSTSVDPGETSVVVYLPVNQEATVLAVDTVNGTTVGRRQATTHGNTLL